MTPLAAVDRWSHQPRDCRKGHIGPGRDGSPPCMQDACTNCQTQVSDGTDYRSGGLLCQQRDHVGQSSKCSNGQRWPQKNRSLKTPSSSQPEAPVRAGTDGGKTTPSPDQPSPKAGRFVDRKCFRYSKQGHIASQWAEKAPKVEPQDGQMLPGQDGSWW